MLKLALFAAVLLAVASLAIAESPAFEPTAASAATVPCRPGQSPAVGCAMRALDTDGDGSISAAELANLAVPAADPAPLPPTQAAGLAFQDAATVPVPVLPASLNRDSPQRLIPAIFALGALVILLRRRPN